MEITEEDFERYEAVRSSGVTNMFNRTLVCELSGLTKDQVKSIMTDYEELLKQYPNVRK